MENPHLVPVWYFYDGTNIIVSTPKETKKTKNLQSNPNVSIIIDIVDGRVEDLSYATKAKAVIIEGIASCRTTLIVRLQEKHMKGMLVRIHSTIHRFNLV